MRSRYTNSCWRSSAEAPQDSLAEARFSSTCAGLKELRGWLKRQAVQAVVMESTAQYWWPIWLELEPHWELFLAQARSNTAPHGRKTDFRDASRLVRRFFSRDLRFSFVPPPEQRRWLRLVHTWKSLGEQIVEARNEIEALLEEGQIKFACVLSDLTGTSGRRVLRALADGETEAARLTALCERRVRASQQQRIDALGGHLSGTHRLVLRQQLDHIEFLEEQRAELQAALTELLRDYEPVVRRLVEVPGVNVAAAQHLVAELGATAAAFPTARQLAPWAGVCPGRQESAGLSCSNRCPHGNRFVRGLICQIAHAASRTKGSYWQGLFQHWQRRLGPKKALWAVAHRLLRLVWKILAQEVDYIEHGPRQTDIRLLQGRMKRLRHDFRQHGFDVIFTPRSPLPLVYRKGLSSVAVLRPFERAAPSAPNLPAIAVAESGE